MMKLHQFKKLTDHLSSTDSMPVLFVGHGSPMNGIEDNAYSEAWVIAGKTMPRPQAILCISAHWFTRGTFVHGAEKPKTIHDFWGFPRELYDLSYPCPGAPELARETQDLLKKTTPVGWDLDWGIDHGTWIVLHRMFPKADIPVYQLSIDLTKPSQFHYELAKELAPLRKKGVLIIGSGNVVHNLGMISFEEDAKPFDWAESFNERLKTFILDRDHKSLMRYEKLGEEAQLSIPTPDHYWPLLYALALQEKHEQAEVFVDGITHGSVSMLSLMIG